MSHLTSIKPQVLVITHIPSPYQVELFNAIAIEDILDLKVIYLYTQLSVPTKRLWQLSQLNHNHLIINDDANFYLTLEKQIQIADLVVFNYYRHPWIPTLMKYRHMAGKPWCFWGERPGYRRLGVLGSYFRRWKLNVLHRSNVPIWGIGEWAVDQYRREFGRDRLYINFPYFSDLARFRLNRRVEKQPSQFRNFLFSGSLIHRKGVDLLATAFCRLAQEHSFVQLTLMGEGKLRPILETQLAEYSDRVQWVGFQQWDQLPQIYQTADVLCVPSRYDGWALVVPEGLATGLPIISTQRTGAALEFVRHQNNGWLIPPGSETDLYQSMQQAALLSAAELKNYSEAARQSIANHSLKEGITRFHQAVSMTLTAYKV